MPDNDQGDGRRPGDLAFVVVSAGIFLVVAACVVYFVIKIVL
jgi:hypothetical protein